MKTKFKKFTEIKEYNHPKWSSYFTAGDAWLETLQKLEDNKNNIGWGVFYVIPWVVSFCIELYCKAIASHYDQEFNGKKYHHKTSDVIKEYSANITIFTELLNNNSLMKLINEYEKTIDTKFGETIVEIDGDEKKELIEVIYKLRGVICKRTGLR